jgi:RNA polymerase sigma-70 factor (ECF subfamily)
VGEKLTLKQFLSTPTEEGFRPLFGYLYPRLYRFYLLQGLEAMLAEDLAQEVLLIVYRKAADLREPELFYGWLFQIARHEMARHWRRKPKLEMVSFEPLSVELAARLTTELPLAEQSRLAGWLAKLDPVEREIVTLRFLDELSYDEIALALSIPIGTVKSRLFHVRKKLAAIIEGELNRESDPAALNHTLGLLENRREK